ncbi:MAG: hypothetical protein B7Y90_17250 [Alphaproteobacteria bacterium 32-64-14]|nr:MAG: hypothetical protein B7Y90_17250 [Alphaproteobacteria bacterium 32-64-14]
MASSIETFGGNTDLLEKLNTEGVRFLVVGGVAVKFYVPERQIDDLDILLDKRPDNVARLLDALRPLYGNNIPPEHLTQSAKAQMPLKHFHYADVVTADDSFDFDAEWGAGSDGLVNGQPVRFASRGLLIRHKAGGERPKDASDLALLRGADA